MFQRLRLCVTTHCRLFSNRNILSLRERGAIQDVFPENSDKVILDMLNASPQCVYAGFDPTADSLHIGNLLVIVNLLNWQRGGHQIIALIGGATGCIGDPSGRTKDRPQLEKIFIDDNIKGITSNIENIFTNHAKYFWDEDKCMKEPIITNNEDWYKKMNAIQFASNVGRNFRMGTMLLKQSVQSRINSDAGMSFTEFTYQLFQAYDWLHLYNNYKCYFQVGGSDQMGNILAGFDLIRRVTKKSVYGITLPLITNEEGDKFGKSGGNAIWLNSSKTSPFAFYQFFFRTPDSDIEKLLKYFTFLPLGKIKDIMLNHEQKPENKLPQKTLADFLTVLVHGEEGLNKAKLCSKLLYGNDVNLLLNLNASDICVSFEGAPVIELVPEPGMTVLDLAMKAKCFLTESYAMRIIKAGGFYINYQKVTNFQEVLVESSHILPNKITVMRVGKKNYSIVKWL
ncbi:tyrosine--tRNA ligase, mitochondrial [Arctopsyche grandis]|uniref:tyrosine--tRNA ligase, mitochondrial n=1 Tax=Arctopsyche grandis TaxID=121162 RepID=UPI00406D7DF0